MPTEDLEVEYFDEDDPDGLEIDDPDLCDYCGVNNALWGDGQGVGWCGECDKNSPRIPRPSDN